MKRFASLVVFISSSFLLFFIAYLFLIGEVRDLQTFAVAILLIVVGTSGVYVFVAEISTVQKADNVSELVGKKNVDSKWRRTIGLIALISAWEISSYVTCGYFVLSRKYGEKVFNERLFIALNLIGLAILLFSLGIYFMRPIKKQSH